MRPSPSMMVALIAVFCALGGVAGAALVGDGNVVKACVSKDGTLKVVDSTTTACPGTQTMVSFAGVDGNGAVANADKLDGKDSTDFLDKSGQATSAATAGNADKLDGKDSSEFLGKTEKAASAASADNADTLDGMDSSAFGRFVGGVIDEFGHVQAGSKFTVRRPGAGLLPHHHPRLSHQRLQGRLCRHRPYERLRPYVRPPSHCRRERWKLRTRRLHQPPTTGLVDAAFSFELREVN